MALLSNRVKDQLDSAGALVPVGTIMSYAPGYFNNVGNGGGWVHSGPGGNTVAQINSYLPSNWRVCDGAAPNDPDSPIFNSASRYLPELTGSRFTMGFSSAGTAGGNTSNQVTLAISNMPSHNHNMDHGHGHNLTKPSQSLGVTNINLAGGATAGGNHNHTYVTNSLSAGANTTGSFGQSTDLTANTGGTGAHSHTVTGTTNIDHTHDSVAISGSVTSHTGNTGSQGTGTAFDIRPLYVSVFYIMRIK